MKKDYSKLKCYNICNPIKVLFRDKKYSIETYLNDNTNKASNVIVVDTFRTYFDNQVIYNKLCDKYLVSTGGYYIPNYICQKLINLARKKTEGFTII